MSTWDLKHPWKPSVWIIWIGVIVLGSWLLQGLLSRVGNSRVVADNVASAMA